MDYSGLGGGLGPSSLDLQMEMMQRQMEYERKRQMIKDKEEVEEELRDFAKLAEHSELSPYAFEDLRQKLYRKYKCVTAVDHYVDNYYTVLSADIEDGDTINCRYMGLTSKKMKQAMDEAEDRAAEEVVEFVKEKKKKKDKIHKVFSARHGKLRKH